MVTSHTKSKTVPKLGSERSCIPCFRELSALSVLEQTFTKKRNEFVSKITDSLSVNLKVGKRKVEKSLPVKILSLSRELVPQTAEVRVEQTHTVSLDSLIQMNSDHEITAEITITQDGNGGAAIDFEVVDSNSDLKKQNGHYGCRFCKREFISLSSSITHMQTIHGKLVHTCDTCGHEFQLKSDLDHHRANHLKDGPLPYQCGVCPKGFKFLERYNDHIKLHEQKKKFGCAQCGRKFADEVKLNTHMANHKRKPFSCQRCKKTFRNFHNCTKHSSTNEDNQRYVCNLCNKVFTTATSLHIHLKNHNKAYKCGVCGRGYDAENQLKEHISSHTNHRRFECHTCGKSFASFIQLECHNRVHTGERPFQCDACGATFAQRSNLDSHHRAVHLQERRFKCQECDKSFKRRRLLDYHIRSVHTGERPYSCTQCNATFVYPEHYKKHMMTHSGIKPFACEICGKTFSSKDNRNTHRFTHSDRKPYECQVCCASFMRKPHLLQHLIEEGHGDPETAGAAVKIVQVLSGPEVEQSTDEIEWGELDMSTTGNLDASHIQAIIIPDENGRPIEFQVIGTDSHDHENQLPSFELNGETFRMSELLKHTELQECTVEETLDSLL